MRPQFDSKNIDAGRWPHLDMRLSLRHASQIYHHPGLIRVRGGWHAASPPFRFASLYERHFNQPSDRFGPRWFVFL
jgi:hypothetical protein